MEVFFILLTFCTASLVCGLYIGSQAQEGYMKDKYCQTLGAEYHDIREHGVCILPSGEVKDINF